MLCLLVYTLYNIHISLAGFWRRSFIFYCCFCFKHRHSSVGCLW